MKKILFLAPATNYHTRKWCAFFVSRKYEVYVVSLTNAVVPDVVVYNLLANDKSGESELKKIGYLFTVRRLNRIYEEIKPDIVSVHYATSYGLLAALSKIKKYSLSVWGTDVYAFPLKSVLHKKIVEYSLSKATILMSTSKAMAVECEKYTKRDFYITPFGVDMELFRPRNEEQCGNDVFTIATIKSLSPEYGIDVLLRAIKQVVNDIPQIQLCVNIAGVGPSAEYLNKLSQELGIDDMVNWLGLIPQSEVIRTLNVSDVAVIPSYRESFGVSAVEAQACGLPVIISDVDGLKEATEPGITSVGFKPGDYQGLAKAIECLYQNKEKRIEMGGRAREFVRNKFEYKRCFKNIEQILCNV